MSIDYKKTATVKKKIIPKDTPAINFGIPPKSGQECQPPFVWVQSQFTDNEDAYYEYKNSDNQTCFFVRRYEPYTPGNDSPKKKIAPYSYDLISATWKCGWWEKDRPLFHEERLVNSQNTVIILEGEKTTQIAEKLFPKYDAVSWSGGSKAMSLTTYAALKDKKVILFPDNDKPGLEAMHEVAKILLEEGITEDVSLIKLPKELPDGWDVADPLNIAGTTYEGILNNNYEYDPDEYSKVWDKINKREEKKESKTTAADIGQDLTYVQVNDMYHQKGTTIFLNSQQINNMNKHRVKGGTLTDMLLKDPDFAKADTFITSAKYAPGLMKITKPGVVPLINKGTVLNIYIPNYLEPKAGDVQFIIDFYEWLLGRDKWSTIEQWITYNIQQPGIKIKWALVLVSAIEGTGKGMLARIISRILGAENVIENANYKHLINTHSTLLVGTQVLVLNEVSLGDFKSKNEGTNALKNFVADPTYTCNFKGKTMVVLANLTNIILFSNDITVLGVKDGTRRYFFCNINKLEEDIIKKSNSGFFDKAWSFIDSDEGAAALLNHFKNVVKIDDPSIFQKRAPITKDLEELIEQSKHPMQKVLEHDLTRQDLMSRKIFDHTFTGLITFNDLNERLRTTDKDDTEQYKWPTYGDDALVKFLSAVATQWNNGDTTRQISINGIKHRFHLLDDTRCPIPGKSYKDLTPKQIETIQLNFRECSTEIDNEEYNVKDAKEKLPELEKQLKEKIKSWCDPGKYGDKKFQGRNPEELFTELMTKKLKLDDNDHFLIDNIIQKRKYMKDGVRNPEDILEDIRNRFGPNNVMPRKFYKDQTPTLNL